jgi:hypothetical protein
MEVQKSLVIYWFEKGYNPQKKRETQYGGPMLFKCDELGQSLKERREHPGVAFDWRAPP